MIGRVIEIAGENRHLTKERGFMVVRAESAEEGRVPLDDIAAVIATGRGLTHSTNLLVELAVRNAPFVLCGPNFAPVALLWGVDGHHRQAARFDAQLAATKPLQKRLWRDVVRAKITQQAAVLAAFGQPTAPLDALVAKVRAGDPENVEATAAQRYWPAVFGRDFRRDRTAPGVNARLNYGYMVLRAAAARAIMGAGLHPTLGIHHRHGGNPMRLADDLMEPFRPLIDLTVSGLADTDAETLDRDHKKVLAGVLHAGLRTSAGTTPLIGAVQRLAISLAQAYLGERDGLDFPAAQTPLELTGAAKP